MGGELEEKGRSHGLDKDSLTEQLKKRKLATIIFIKRMCKASDT